MIFSEKNENSQSLGWIDISRDASEEELQKLLQQEKLALIGQMAAGIVHEIKNPLATIKGLNQLIKARAQDDWIKSYAQIVEGAIDDVTRVANEFLNFAKPKNQNCKEIYINELIESMKFMLCSYTFKKGVKTEFFLSEQQAPVNGDELQIKQVILNLCQNAIDSMEGIPQPKLSIYTEYNSDKGEMLITVEDNGRGIPKDILKKLGTPFFTTKEKGTGLGLSVCYEIMKAHGGRIEIHSEPGSGARFTLILPCSG